MIINVDGDGNNDDDDDIGGDWIVMLDRAYEICYDNNVNGYCDIDDVRFFVMEMKPPFYSWTEVWGEKMIPIENLCTYGFILVLYKEVKTICGYILSR